MKTYFKHMNKAKTFSIELDLFDWALPIRIWYFKDMCSLHDVYGVRILCIGLNYRKYFGRTWE